MLVGLFSAISLLAAVGMCFGTGAFAGLSFLWILPVSFVGVFLGLVLAWFVLLVIMAACVRMDVEYKEDAPLYRKAMHLTADALITLLRVHIHVEGMEKAPESGRFLLVCNHLDDTDPVVLLTAFRNSQISFISKRENDKKFIIGPFLRKIGCQPINRENNREALKTILTCVSILKEDKLSIGVFPEGYIHEDRKLHPFRSGVFKIAQKAGVPIVVCTLKDTQYIFRNAKRLKPSHAYLHVLGVIPVSQVQGVTTVELGNRIHAMMAQDLGPENVTQENT